MKNTANLKLILTTILFLGMGFYSCRKHKFSNSSSEMTSVSKFSTFASFRNSLNKNVQKFTINASAGGKIIGDKGYRFYFKPGTLVNFSGNPVSGNVNISLIEVTNAYSMIATGAGTRARDGILGSAGMFKLDATQNGQPLYINPNNPVVAQIMVDPNVNMDNVDLFAGSEFKDTSTNDTAVNWSRDSINWKYNQDSLMQVWDSLNKIYMQKRCITFDLYFTSWCNLDMYYNDPNGAFVDVEVPEAKDNLDTRVIFYINENYTKGLYEPFNRPTITNWNCSPYNLPIGWKIKIIVVTRDSKKQVKYQVKDIINTANTKHTMNNFIGVTDEELEKFFKNL